MVKLRRDGSKTVAIPPLVLDRSNPAPLYHRVAQHIGDAIERGDLVAGDRLDGEIGLAESLGISRATMRRAIEELVAQGVLARKHGFGTQVLSKPNLRSTGVRSLFDELAAAGRSPRSKVMRLEVVEAQDEVASALEVPAGTPVTHLERIRYADEVPFAIMRNWIPASLIELDAGRIETGGLYEELRNSGIRMRVARQSIGAEAATAEQARLLDVSPGEPLLNIHTVTLADLGHPVEFGSHDYRANSYRFEMTSVER